ncbi:MAG: hypothetical protein EOM91_18050 [Sphingobacteriia bacterium]|nr:hypothetical protein [Sphingobacteriia bacterium]
MRLTKSQVIGFVDTLLGCETLPDGSSGDYLSPLVAAYLRGVLPEMVSAYHLSCGPGGSRATVEHRERFCAFLEAVVETLRNGDSGEVRK